MSPRFYLSFPISPYRSRSSSGVLPDDTPREFHPPRDDLDKYATSVRLRRASLRTRREMLTRACGRGVFGPRHPALYGLTPFGGFSRASTEGSKLPQNGRDKTGPRIELPVCTFFFFFVFFSVEPYWRCSVIETAQRPYERKGRSVDSPVADERCQTQRTT